VAAGIETSPKYKSTGGESSMQPNCMQGKGKKPIWGKREQMAFQNEEKEHEELHLNIEAPVQ
jgi:hypothetical protein